MRSIFLSAASDEATFPLRNELHGVAIAQTRKQDAPRSAISQVRVEPEATDRHDDVGVGQQSVQIDPPPSFVLAR